MRHSILFTLLILLFSSSLFAEDIEFTAQAKSAVLSGEKFQLIYSVNEEGEDLRLPQLNDFTVLMGPSVMTSSSTQIITEKSQGVNNTLIPIYLNVTNQVSIH